VIVGAVDVDNRSVARIHRSSVCPSGFDDPGRPAFAPRAALPSDSAPQAVASPASNTDSPAMGSHKATAQMRVPPRLMARASTLPMADPH